jgi:His/Glu/Gln/Arg/opine family amino acid ABC transporter permease subunit
VDWSVIWQYRFAILQGLIYTVGISVLAIIGSFVLGTLLGCLRLLRSRILDEVINSYVEVVRNIPLIVKLFFFYYILGLDAFPSGLMALTVHQSGYIADVIASGFRSVHAEQSESGYAQGLARSQVFIFILLPQVARLTLPPLTSQFIEVVKNSAIVMFVGVQELTFETQEIVHATLRGFEAATVATLLYVAITLTLAGGMSKLGQRLRWA